MMATPISMLETGTNRPMGHGGLQLPISVTEDRTEIVSGSSVKAPAARVHQSINSYGASSPSTGAAAGGTLGGAQGAASGTQGAASGTPGAVGGASGSSSSSKASSSGKASGKTAPSSSKAKPSSSKTASSRSKAKPAGKIGALKSFKMPVRARNSVHTEWLLSVPHIFACCRLFAASAKNPIPWKRSRR